MSWGFGLNRLWRSFGTDQGFCGLIAGRLGGSVVAGFNIQSKFEAVGGTVGVGVVLLLAVELSGLTGGVGVTDGVYGHRWKRRLAGLAPRVALASAQRQGLLEPASEEKKYRNGRFLRRTSWRRLT